MRAACGFFLKAVLLAACAAVLVSLCACSDSTRGASGEAQSPSSQVVLSDQLVEQGQLHIACAFDSVPYAAESFSAKSGYAFEFSQKLADELGLELVWDKADYDASALSRADADGERAVGGSYVKSDLALATTGDAAKLVVDGAELQPDTASGQGGADGQASSLSRCATYLETPLCLVARKAADVDAEALSSAGGAKLGVVAGSPAAIWGAREFTACEIVSYATPTELFSAVQARNVDAAIADTAQASYHTRVSYGDEHVVKTWENAVASYALVCDAGKTALAEALGRAADSLEDAGAMSELYTAWFEQPEKDRNQEESRTPEQGAPTHDKGGGV